MFSIFERACVSRSLRFPRIARSPICAFKSNGISAISAVASVRRSDSIFESARRLSTTPVGRFVERPAEKPQPPDPPAPGVVARFKQMYRDYWYVLVPVHLVTSACWLGGFYYLAKSGVDVIALLKSTGVSDRFTDPLKDSSMGYVALAYALYKVATPVRYTVTLGGTTISIKYLQAWGYIKPMPSTEKLKEMYQERKEGLQEMYQETRQELRQRKYQIKERKDNVMSDIAKYKREMEEIKRGELKNK